MRTVQPLLREYDEIVMYSNYLSIILLAHAKRNQLYFLHPRQKTLRHFPWARNHPQISCYRRHPSKLCWRHHQIHMSIKSTSANTELQQCTPSSWCERYDASGGCVVDAREHVLDAISKQTHDKSHLLRQQQWVCYRAHCHHWCCCRHHHPHCHHPAGERSQP